MQYAARVCDPSGTVASIDVSSVARNRREWLHEHLSKWGDFSRSVPHFHEVQGEHYTMLDPQHVLSFHKKLQSVWKERGV